MSFIHEDPEFEALRRIVAEERGISIALIEKDYWVAHSLWALHRTGLEIWFKGGTSLSKGFGLIQRLSEDLDLRIEAGAAAGVPAVKSWTSTNKRPVGERRELFAALEKAMAVPAAEVTLDAESVDKYARAANYRVVYPGRFLADLGPFRPFVLLEVGVARVTPFVERRISSFVHDRLERDGQLTGYDDNRPGAVRCVHPMVTLLEKLDAIGRRYPRDPMEPAGFVRHYEDAAAILSQLDRLPPLEMDPRPPRRGDAQGEADRAEPGLGGSGARSGRRGPEEAARRRARRHRPDVLGRAAIARRLVRDHRAVAVAARHPEVSRVLMRPGTSWARPRGHAKSGARHGQEIGHFPLDLARS